MDSIFKYYPFDHYDSRYGMDSVRYKFSGKERDRETGYDYMEQRYYWNSGSFWLRPDPLMDKYLNAAPYAYCNGNPLKYVNPNGEWFETAWDIDGGAKSSGGTSGNSINGVSPQNPNAEKYIQAAKKEFGEL